MISQTDHISNIPYTLDPASSVSLFPNTFGINNNSSRVQLYNSVSNSIIPLRGTIERTIQLGSNYYTWTFFIADINNIVLGADFIHHFTYLNHTV